MNHYSYGGRNNGWLKWVAVCLLTLSVLIVISVASTTVIYQSNLAPVSSNSTSKLIVVESGSSADEIASKLQKEGLIRSAWAFSLHIRLNGLRGQLQAGTYALKPNMPASEIATIISRGKVDTKLVTILPGQRLIDQIRDNLINVGFDSTEVDAALDPNLYLDHPALSEKPPGASLEGYTYPETFQKTDVTKPQDIIRASLDEMNKRLTSELKSAFANQGLTTHQAIILASIIEKEVSKPDEKAQASQVFLKRLRSNITLGADPTAVYGAVLAGQEPSIFYDSAYNTHKHGGLPPSPISNVSENSLKAVAYPADTDWLYFVSGDDGITYFSKTLAEHEALTRTHCKKLCNTVQ